MRADFDFEGDFEFKPHQDVKPRILMVCPPTINAYHLGENIWMTVFIDDLKDVQFLDEAPKTLVMEAEKKSLLVSLVQSHLSQMSEDQEPPIQRQPGILEREKGLTLLLHGGPGTGKTFAATCVAETVKCPLLSDTIGIRDSSSVEQRLSKLFQLTQRWHAILVLENADAFLTQRSRNEAGSSAVTLAIRSMDSYTGILILTTSRVGDLDEAVWSYTDLAINFPPLRGERLQKVWGQSISEYKVKYYSRIMDFIEDICRTEGLEINGRDIRNITLAAQNLAKHQNRFLEVQHIQAVLENRKEFMKYIKDLSGSDMAGRAMQMQIRNDAEPEKGKGL